jgi:hypothetical protein
MIDGVPQAPPLPLPVKLLPQNPRALEQNHPPGIKLQISAGRRVSSLSLRLLFHNEFPESADQDIVPVFQGLFDQFENVVDQDLGLLLGEADLIIEGLDKVFFNESHEWLLWDFVGEDTYHDRRGEVKGIFETPTLGP